MAGLIALLVPPKTFKPTFPELFVMVNVPPVSAIANEFKFVKEMAPREIFVSRDTVVKAEPTPSTAKSPGAPGMAGLPLQSAAADQLPLPSWIQVLPPTETVNCSVKPSVLLTVPIVPAEMPAPVNVAAAANEPVIPPLAFINV